MSFKNIHFLLLIFKNQPLCDRFGFEYMWVFEPVWVRWARLGSAFPHSCKRSDSIQSLTKRCRRRNQVAQTGIGIALSSAWDWDCGWDWDWDLTRVSGSHRLIQNWVSKSISHSERLSICGYGYGLTIVNSQQKQASPKVQCLYVIRSFYCFPYARKYD